MHRIQWGSAIDYGPVDARPALDWRGAGAGPSTVSKCVSMARFGSWSLGLIWSWLTVVLMPINYKTVFGFISRF